MLLRGDIVAGADRYCLVKRARCGKRESRSPHIGENLNVGNKTYISVEQTRTPPPTQFTSLNVLRVRLMVGREGFTGLQTQHKTNVTYLKD